MKYHTKQRSSCKNCSTSVSIIFLIYIFYRFQITLITHCEIRVDVSLSVNKRHYKYISLRIEGPKPLNVVVAIHFPRLQTNQTEYDMK